ncbi:MAG TPA: aminopeptidase [Thermoanaerobaculia bacterium]|jgi:leucyl aminopeptidase (aminopeptidase T)|nr:aminopeptidase [Thermoanaerobaculia bacterium]
MRQQDPAVSPELIPGAHNAIHTCLRLRPEERITLITDRATSDIAAALVREVEELGAEHSLFVLEDYAPRPLAGMPRPILEDLARSQVSIFAAQAQMGELGSRIAMTDVINRKGIRHGHMVNISRQVMTEGMRADFLEVDRLSSWLIDKARPARQIRVTSKGGTDVTATFAPHLKWIKTSGIITPEKWGNLPGGEIFTAPDNVDGRFVVDGVVGDYLCAKYGDLKETPLTVDVRDNRIAGLACDNRELLEEFRSYTSTDGNSDRVGEFAIGTNIAVEEVRGNILQDEKIPGVHIAFGNPYSEHTGQNWTSTTHIDCVGRDFDIWIDGEAVMREGRFLC